MIFPLLFVFFILASSLVIIITNYKSSDYIIEKEISQTYINVVEEKNMRIQDEAEKADRLFSIILLQDDIKSLLGEKNTVYWKNKKILDMREYITLNTYNSDVFDIYIYGYNGVEFYYKDITFQLRNNFDDSRWFVEPDFSKANGIHWFGLCPSEVDEGSYYFIAVKPIKAMINGEIKNLGKAYLFLKENFIRKSINDLDNGGSMQVIDSNNRIIYSDNREELGKTFVAENIKLAEGEKAGYYITQNNNKRRIVIVSSPSSYGWRIIYERSYFPLMTQFKLNKYYVYAVIILGFFIISVYTIVYYTKVNNPLKEMYTKIKSLNLDKIHGNAIQGSDIDLINYEVDMILNENMNYLEKLSKMEKDNKLQEIKKLEAQINPHFLYNVMNNIRAIAILKEEPEIIKMIDSLFELLKGNMGKNEGLITMKKEIENVRYYINIMDIIYENNVDFSFILDKSLDDKLIPRFLMQPIVENSLYHGIDPNKKGGKITIKNYEKEDGIYLEVIDNGTGMNKETIEKILNYDRNNKNHIGIMNTDRKIKLYFGQEYGLIIYSSPGKGTRVVVKIPAI